MSKSRKRTKRRKGNRSIQKRRRVYHKKQKKSRQVGRSYYPAGEPENPSICDDQSIPRVVFHALNQPRCIFYLSAHGASLGKMIDLNPNSQVVSVIRSGKSIKGTQCCRVCNMMGHIENVVSRSFIPYRISESEQNTRISYLGDIYSQAKHLVSGQPGHQFFISDLGDTGPDAAPEDPGSAAGEVPGASDSRLTRSLKGLAESVKRLIGQGEPAAPAGEPAAPAGEPAAPAGEPAQVTVSATKYFEVIPDKGSPPESYCPMIYHDKMLDLQLGFNERDVSVSIPHIVNKMPRLLPDTPGDTIYPGDMLCWKDPDTELPIEMGLHIITCRDFRDDEIANLQETLEGLNARHGATIVKSEELSEREYERVSGDGFKIVFEPSEIGQSTYILVKFDPGTTIKFSELYKYFTLPGTWHAFTCKTAGNPVNLDYMLRMGYTFPEDIDTNGIGAIFEYCSEKTKDYLARMSPRSKDKGPSPDLEYLKEAVDKLHEYFPFDGRYIGKNGAASDAASKLVEKIKSGCKGLVETFKESFERGDVDQILRLAGTLKEALRSVDPGLVVFAGKYVMSKEMFGLIDKRLKLHALKSSAEPVTEPVIKSIVDEVSKMDDTEKTNLTTQIQGTRLVIQSSPHGGPTEHRISYPMGVFMNEIIPLCTYTPQGETTRYEIDTMPHTYYLLCRPTLPGIPTKGKDVDVNSVIV